jgi:hypothetical protein
MVFCSLLGIGGRAAGPTYEGLYSGEWRHPQCSQTAAAGHTAIHDEPGRRNRTVRERGHITGMLGVYLTAAELTKLGFIVSPTSRSAFGADLLVTDQRCRKAWSVQVKTNRKAAAFWLVNAHAGDSYSDSHVYVFVNLRGDSRPDYFVVPSTKVAAIYQKKPRNSSVWYSVHQRDMPDFAEAWGKVFGDASTEAELTAEA